MTRRSQGMTDVQRRLQTPGHSRACPAPKVDKLGVDPVGAEAIRNADERCDRRTLKVRTDATKLRRIMQRHADDRRTAAVGTWGTGGREDHARATLTPGVILVRNVK